MREHIRRNSADSHWEWNAIHNGKESRAHGDWDPFRLQGKSKSSDVYHLHGCNNSGAFQRKKEKRNTQIFFSQKHMVSKPIAYRFVAEVDSENHWEPIVGIFDERNPLLSINQAARYLPEYPKYDIQKEVAKAIERMREDDMRRKIASVPGMTESGAAALWLYTLNGPLYRDLNGRLRSQSRDYLRDHYHPFIRILLTAMKLLQSGERQCLYHAVNHDIAGEAGEKKMYGSEKSFAWWPFISATSVVGSLQQFFADRGKQTIFQIDSSQGADVSGFSAFGGDEAELLLPPGTALRCLGVMRSGNTTIIQCEDDEKAPKLIF